MMKFSESRLSMSVSPLRRTEEEERVNKRLIFSISVSKQLPWYFRLVERKVNTNWLIYRSIHRQRGRIPRASARRRSHLAGLRTQSARNRTPSGRFRTDAVPENWPPSNRSSVSSKRKDSNPTMMTNSAPPRGPTNLCSTMERRNRNRRIRKCLREPHSTSSTCHPVRSSRTASTLSKHSNSCVKLRR